MAMGKRALVVAGVLGGVVLAGVLASGPLLGWGLRQWAAQRGMTLAFERLTIRPGVLTLEGVSLKLASIEGLDATSRRATFHVKHLTPQGLVLEAPRVHFSGSPQQAMALLTRWNKEGDLLPPSLSISQAEVVAQSPGASQPWLHLQGARATTSSALTEVEVDSAKIARASLGHQRVFWQRAPEGAWLGLGEDPKQAPLRAFFPSGGELPVVRVEAHRLALRPMASALGLPASAKRVELDGHATLTFLPDEAIDGKVDLALLRYTPPHPAEIASLVQSDRTTVKASFHVPPDRAVISVVPLSVAAGKLTLTGNGTLTPSPERVAFRGAIHGALPCALVARSAAVADLGGLVGGVLGGLAEAALQGDLQVSVHIEADSRNLAAASFKPTVTARCSASL